MPRSGAARTMRRTASTPARWPAARGKPRRILQLARVYAEIAVAGLEQRLELVERETVTHRERAHDREPHALVNQAVERRGRRMRVGFHTTLRVQGGARDPGCVALSHHTSVQ